MKWFNNLYELNIPGYIEIQQERRAIYVEKLNKIRARPENMGNIPMERLINDKKYENSAVKFPLFSPEEKQAIIKDDRKYKAKLNDLIWNFWITRIAYIITAVISMLALIVSICKK
ncbi:MAG: hypothetical protein LBQ14_02655 [Treponema sp.]|jgi:hypothetical protein|nr:hypothetical protein [Treponema sp.]